MKPRLHSYCFNATHKHHHHQTVIKDSKDQSSLFFSAMQDIIDSTALGIGDDPCPPRQSSTKRDSSCIAHSHDDEISTCTKKSRFDDHDATSSLKYHELDDSSIIAARLFTKPSFQELFKDDNRSYFILKCVVGCGDASLVRDFFENPTIGSGSFMRGLETRDKWNLDPVFHECSMMPLTVELKQIMLMLVEKGALQSESSRIIGAGGRLFFTRFNISLDMIKFLSGDEFKSHAGFTIDFSQVVDGIIGKWCAENASFGFFGAKNCGGKMSKHHAEICDHLTRAGVYTPTSKVTFELIRCLYDSQYEHLRLFELFFESLYRTSSGYNLPGSNAQHDFVEQAIRMCNPNIVRFLTSKKVGCG
jgi:hypothetical protein